MIGEMPGAWRWIRNGDAMTSEKINYWLLDEVIGEVQRCEAIQDTNVNDYTKEREKINAYEDIRDILRHYIKNEEN